MSVLVTGGAGYIGSHLVHDLLDRGEQVVVLDNLSSGLRWAVPDGAPLVVGDAGDAALVGAVIERFAVDEIVHFAASTVVPESVANPLAYYANNTCVLRSLMDVASRAGVARVIFSSTAAVYGTPEHAVVDESTRLKPISPYGASKMMSERIIADAEAAEGPAYVILRYFNVAGADPAGRAGQSTAGATHLIKVACETALGLRPGLTVFGTNYPTPDGTCIRDYIHVSDLSAAHLNALRYLRGGGASDVFNCGYGHGFSVKEVIAAVEKVSGVDFPVTLGARRLGDPVALIAAADKVRATLGWRPRFDDLDTIVRHALAWERHLLGRTTAQVQLAGE
jgi:UDP-glucose 4-epimerase